jgi:hypothetical protein
MLSWSDAAQAQLAGGNLRPAFFFRVATAPVLRLWVGIGDFSVPADRIEVADSTFLGFAELQALPVLTQLINGQADRAEFGIAGAAVTSDVVRLASEEADSVRGAEVHVGFAVLGADLQLASPIAWIWHGVADSLSVQRDDSQEQPIRSISLSVGSLFTGRRRPGISFWTDRDQKQRSATDQFCERVGTYSQGTTKTWPM